MTDQLISFETANLACKKGFRFKPDLITDMYIDSAERVNHVHRGFMCPTQSLLQKWLRKNHDIYVNICYEGHYIFSVGIRNQSGYDLVPEYNCLPITLEFEEAFEEGLIKALELIQ